MSMTREEAIAAYENLYKYMLGDEEFVGLSYGEFMGLSRYIRAVLCTPTREQVERMFPGCALCNWGGLDCVGVDGDGIYLSKPQKNEKFRFCPVCGKPLTDEAADMMLERMETVYGQASD